MSSAVDYGLSPPAKQAAEGPAIVAEMTTEVANLTDPELAPLRWMNLGEA